MAITDIQEILDFMTNPYAALTPDFNEDGEIGASEIYPSVGGEVKDDFNFAYQAIREIVTQYSWQSTPDDFDGTLDLSLSPETPAQLVSHGEGNNVVFDRMYNGYNTHALGDGKDMYSGGGLYSEVYGDAGNDLLVNSGVTRAYFHGGEGDDTFNLGAIDGGSGSFMMATGGTGKDTFTGGRQEVNIVLAGEGDDLVSRLAGPGFVDLGTGSDVLTVLDQVIAFGGEGEDILKSDSQEQVMLNGGEGSDRIEVTTGADENVLFGGAGDDTIISGTGRGNMIAGGDGHDTITTSDQRDIIVLEPGTDNVDTITKLGKDVFDVTAFGFADFGELTAAISSGSLKKNKGGIAGGVKFTLTTADGEVTVEILNSPTLKDYHFGFVPDASEITGDAETLITDFDAIADYGLAGFNEMPIAPTGTTGNGTNGQDVYISNNAKDKIKTKGGSDLTFGGDGVNNVNAGGGNDLLFGGSGNDILNGSSGDDVIVGGTGKDKLRGGNDHDVLIGGAENDNLGGGAGADLFIFRSGTGFDKIIDFENDIDTIHIEHLTALGDITHQIIGGKHTRLKLGDGTIQIQNRVIDLDDIQFEFGTSAILDAVDAFTI